VTDPFSTARVRAAYDVAAEGYQRAFGDDLERLPLDRRLLDRARLAARGGVILDLGCGTGSAGSYLAARGGRVVGLDLSAGMLRACRSAGGPPACQGDMRRLPFTDRAFAAVVAYYSLHHLPRSELDAVLAETARVVRPGGALLLGTHLGRGEVYSDTFLGHDIATTGGTLYDATELTDRVSSAGFVVAVRDTRDPLAHEHQTRRIYLLAERAA
jgi:ubiquinone/menaquinone biosynthesis C-methylase UbiE